MRHDYHRHLAQFASKYDLELLRVTGVRNQADVEVAEAAIIELDDALFRSGDKLGSTTAMPEFITVTARRSDQARTRVRTH